MKSLQDIFYNWLSIKVVADARRDDTSAQDTEKLFYELLTVEHGVANIQFEKHEELYIIHYLVEEEKKMMKFPVDLIEVMLIQMQDEPEKFINYR